MKEITNWQNATVADIEADDLLDNATLMHVLSYKMATGNEVKSIRGDNANRIKKFFQHHIDNKIPLVMHNGIGYDVPLVEKLLGMDLSELMLIDTLGLSWHLNPDRARHGLDSFFEDYGIAKPKIDDWENLDYEQYKHRCQTDVEINLALWEDLKSRLEGMYQVSAKAIDKGLVGGKRVSEDEVIYLDSLVGIGYEKHIDRLLTFVMFKMDCARLQEKTRWKVDVEFLDESLEELNGLLETSQSELESVMPKVPQYAPRKKPAKPFKKNGELSASGEAWKAIQDQINSEAKDEAGNPLVVVVDDEKVKVLKSYAEPNINSSQQIKDFLYSKGWEPESFKYERDSEAFDKWIASKPKRGANQSMWKIWKDNKPEDRAIPQVSVDGKNGKELCPSVLALADEVPEIMAYSKYTTIKHRRDLLKGFKENLSEDGYLKARIGGFTNTFRCKHREIVNLPGVDKPYGKNVRGCLIAGEGEVSLGSDLSSLEDRTKHHFMLPHDPEYVETMLAPDFDPHILTACSAGFLTEEEGEEYKAGNKTPKADAARKLGKATNYASVYGSGAPTLARTAKVDLKTAEQLLEGYWKLNWSVKAIAEEQFTFTCSQGQKWLVNPINGFCYSLRKEKDRFSTLCQGTGSFFFDMWVDKTLELMQGTFGTRRLSASFHDEQVIVFKGKNRNKQVMEDIMHKALDMVNEEYKLRRELGCDVQFGRSYAEIH